MIRKIERQYLPSLHTWFAGPPQLMMSFTKPGQIDPELLRARDKEHGKDTEAVKAARKDLQPSQPVAAAADHWEVRAPGF